MTDLDRRIAPPVRPFGHMALPPERVIECGRGTRLHVMADSSCRLVRLCAVGRGGKVEAQSHASAIMTAEILAEGSVSFDADTTAEIIDFNGASIAGRCSDHFTRLDITAMAGAMSELLPVFSALLREPSFSRKRMESVRAMLMSQCACELKRVSTIATQACFGLIAGRSHATARKPVPEDFERVGEQEIMASIGRIFAAPNVDVFLSGGVTPELESAVMAMADSLNDGVRTVPDIRPYVAESPQLKHIECPGAEQSAVVCMLPVIGRSHPDYLPLRIAVTALGGFFGSRLMRNIREDKGLTYGISACLNGTHEGGYVEISAQCAPGYTERLLDELKGELRRMATVPLDRDELLRMRLYEQTRIASMMDNAIASGDQYITQLIVGLPDGYFENQERITAQITSEEIAEVAERYLRPENLRVVIAG